MAFSSGVFTSTSGAVNGDGIFVGNKANTAAQLAKEKKMLYGNGISLDPTSAFYVAPKTGLTATVSAGWGIMEGYWFEESADYDIAMTSSVSEQTLHIGVRLDVATGEYTDSHAAARTTFVPATDRVFAIIVIPANAVTLTSAMITDTRNNSTYCGTVNAQREALATLQAEYTEKLEVLELTGIPIHASTHATGQTDAVSPSAIGAASLDANSKVTANEASSYINAQTDNYTLVLADAGKFIKMTKGTANNLTVPPNSSVAFPIGTEIEVAQYGAGQVTLVAGAGVTLRNADAALKLAKIYAGAVLKKIATNEWLVTGYTVA